MTTHEPRDPEGTGDLFVPLPAIAEQTTRQLHDRLVREAQSKGLLDVAYRTVDSPVGPLLLAATARGLARVAYSCEDHDKVLERLARDLSPRILRAPARLDPAAKQIDEYFTGLRRGFDLRLDLSLARGFRRLVLTRLRAIDYGQTDSYGAVALAVGHPKAVRAVGSACATNPVPVVVPCHRVVRSDGSLGEYVGGVAAKRALLALEAAA